MHWTGEVVAKLASLACSRSCMRHRHACVPERASCCTLQALPVDLACCRLRRDCSCVADFWIDIKAAARELYCFSRAGSKP